MAVAADDFVLPDTVDDLYMMVQHENAKDVPFFKFWLKDQTHPRVMEFWDRVYKIMDEHVPEEYAQGYKCVFVIFLSNILRSKRNYFVIFRSLLSKGMVMMVSRSRWSCPTPRSSPAWSPLLSSLCILSFDYLF